MRLGLRQSLFGATLLGTLVLAAGCASTGQLDILESRLRRQEDAANQLQAQLAESQNQLQAAKRETVDLRTQIANGKKLAHAEQLTALGTVEGISLNKYLTGGLDRDGIPGDEMLSAVVAPADADGNLVKAPGTVVVTVLDLSKPEAQQRVGHWEFGPKDSESLWHSGFLGSGYVVRVPWQTLPESPTLLVHAEWDRDTPAYMAQALFPLLINAPGKRYVQLPEGTHHIMLEKNRLMLFEAVQAFLDESGRS